VSTDGDTSMADEALVEGGALSLSLDALWQRQHGARASWRTGSSGADVRQDPEASMVGPIDHSSLLGRLRDQPGSERMHRLLFPIPFLSNAGGRAAWEP